MSLAVKEGHFFPVTGFCMKRIIPEGALVRAEPCSTAALVPGDVVLMEDEGGFYLHRYLLCLGGGAREVLLTKGDEAERPDSLAGSSKFMGRLVEMKVDGRVARYHPATGERMGAFLSGWFWLVFILLKAARRRVPLLS